MYEALISSLRVCAGNDISCEGCLFAKQDPNAPAYVRYCGIIQEAADALEKLTKENESMEHVIHCCQCKFWNEKNGKCGISLEIIDDPNFFCANGEKDLSKEYIDRKTLLQTAIDMVGHGCYAWELADRIAELEPANARQVVNGMWLAVDDMEDAFDCSRCGAMVQKRVNFCPRCGADMQKSNKLK